MVVVAIVVTVLFLGGLGTTFGDSLLLLVISLVDQVKRLQQIHGELDDQAVGVFRYDSSLACP